MSAARGWDPALWREPGTELVLRYLKYRWLPDVHDLVEASVAGPRLALDDVDLDKDLRELGRAAGGPAFLARLAEDVLRAGAPEPPAAALAPLAPELEAEGVLPFLRLFAVNVAFRLRTDTLLADLLAFTAEAPAPRPDPALVAALVARARPRAEARALLEASPLAGEERDAALAAAEPPPLPPLLGARLHLEGTHEEVERALTRALRPATPLAWPLARTAPTARRFVALRSRGGWTTLLAEGDRPEPALARALAQAGGLPRVVWATLDPGAPDVLVLEGTRTLVDRATLEQRLGAAPDAQDVAGALRALGVLDLDPLHPRKLPELTYAALIGTSLRSKGAFGLAYSG